MSLTYTNDGVSNTPPDDQLCTLDQAKSLAAQLDGAVVNMVDIISPGATVELSAGETRGWFAVTVNQNLYTGVYTPILCSILLKEQAAGKGAWHVNTLNNQPQWVVTPPPTPLPLPIPIPPIIPIFGGATTATSPDWMKEIQAIYSKVVLGQ